MEKTALVICVMKYHDIHLDRLIMKNEELEVPLKRCKELIEKKVCILIEIR